MFVDEITLHLKAGKGGDGIVSWRHEKGIDKAGPGGGDGGVGGDVFVRGVTDVSKLFEYKFEKDFSAEDGETGKGKGMKGAKGKDLVLDVPIGSLIKNLYTDEVFEILDQDPVLVLKGGRGGFGNEHFKSSRNISPEESTPGTVGEESDFYIELRLVADIGFVGLPNAGKSSLLNSLTKAKAKIGNYQFTTLTPNLGDLYGVIIADIPGLIEGASDGKGLGFAFLRHISRTKIIFHCISADTEDVVSAYKTIRQELKNYSKDLADKPEYIVLTKTDMFTPKEIEAKKKALSKLKREVIAVSIIDDMSIKELSDFLVKTVQRG